MATEKNITMREFNGTDYDILYPKTIAAQIPDVYSKTEILTTETLEKYGLTADKLPNDVFQQIKTLIDNTQSSIDSMAKIQTGSYVGTGTYGADNPCSLTFDIIPKIIILYDSNGNGPIEVYSGFSGTGYGYSGKGFKILTNAPTDYTQNWGLGYYMYKEYNYYGYGKISLDRKTYSWFSEVGYEGSNSYAINSQLNVSGTTYYYLGIG